MRRIIWATVWLLVLTLAGCAESHQQSRAMAQHRWELARGRIHMQLAKDSYDNGKLGQCKAQLAKILANEEPYAPAYLLAAKVAMREQRYSEALDYLKLLVRMVPESADAWYAQALICEHQGDLDAALEAITKAQLLDPSDPEYTLCLVEMQVRNGEHDRALATLVAVESRFSTHGGIQSALADLHMMTGDYAAAIPCLKRLALVDQTDQGARERLALCLSRCGQAEESVPLIEALLRKRNDEPVSLRSALGEGYMQLGRYDLAERVWADLVKQQPANADWNFHLAECYAMHGDDRVALDRLEDTILRNPKHADARALAGYLYYAAGNLEKAREHLEVAIQGVDSPAVVAVVLVRTLREMDLAREADEVWAEYGGPLEVARQKGIAGEIGAVPSSSLTLTGQLPDEAVQR